MTYAEEEQLLKLLPSIATKNGPNLSTQLKKKVKIRHCPTEKDGDDIRRIEDHLVREEEVLRDNVEMNSAYPVFPIIGLLSETSSLTEPGIHRYEKNDDVTK